jgi:hypothetical protein
MTCRTKRPVIPCFARPDELRKQSRVYRYLYAEYCRNCSRSARGTRATPSLDIKRDLVRKHIRLNVLERSEGNVVENHLIMSAYIRIKWVMLRCKVYTPDLCPAQERRASDSGSTFPLDSTRPRGIVVNQYTRLHYFFFSFAWVIAFFFLNGWGSETSSMGMEEIRARLDQTRWGGREAVQTQSRMMAYSFPRTATAHIPRPKSPQLYRIKFTS